MLKWLAVWLVLPLLIFGVVTLSAASFRVSVPAKEHQNCLQAAKEARNEQPNCPTQVTLLDRGLADPVAFFTLCLVYFTGALAIVGIGQGLLASQQIRLAREEFNATQRPNIAIRFIEGPTLDEITKRDTVWITFVNKGGSEATVIELGSGLGFWKDSDWEGSRPDRLAKTIAPITLAVGEPHRHPLVVNDDASFQFGFFQAMYQPGDATVCVIGTLRYRDKNEIVRETGFHRFYDARSKCWRPVENSQYEYAD